MFVNSIDDIVVWKASIHQDLRGTFFKCFPPSKNSWISESFQMKEHFIAVSKQNVFRGMHIQISPHPSAKVVSVIKGSIQDFVLDLRENSPTFGKYTFNILSERGYDSVFVPYGVAHGYLCLTEETIVSYKSDISFCRTCDTGVSWRYVSEHLLINSEELIISERDQNLQSIDKFKGINVPH